MSLAVSIAQTEELFQRNEPFVRPACTLEYPDPGLWNVAVPVGRPPVGCQARREEARGGDIAPIPGKPAGTPAG